MRIIFGIIWGIDGALKFSPGMVQALQSMMSTVGSGQPSFLAGWFAFWSKLTLINPTAFVYAQGAVELTLSAALILGFMRKVTYIGGLMTSLLIWSVPEGFGGPYGPGTTDIGTGAIYAVVFLMLMVINATNGASRISLDWYIERKWPFWRHVAELQLTS